MIVFIKADGTPLNVVTSPVYQGSQLNGSLYLVAPYPAQNGVSVRFILPTGEITVASPMTPINEIEGVETEALEGYSIWEWQVNNREITAYAGKVTAQFSISFSEQLQTTASVDFTVERGVLPIIPEEPTTNQWDELIRLYGELSGQLIHPSIVNIEFSKEVPGNGKIYYSNGTTTTFTYPLTEAQVNINEQDNIREIVFTTESWENIIGTYYLWFFPSQTGQKDGKFLANIETVATAENTPTSEIDSTGITREGYAVYIKQDPLQYVFKGNDGFLFITSSLAFNGRVLIDSKAIVDERNFDGVNPEEFDEFKEEVETQIDEANTQIDELRDDKADKYIFFDTENPVDIQSGMDLSGQTIAFSSYYDSGGILVQFENGKYIGSVMGTFGLFPSTDENSAEVVFWEMANWDNEQYTFPTGQGWTVTSVDSFAYHYINIIEHKVVDCEYNYKKIESSLKPLFRYGFTAYITLGNGMPVECYGSALSSDPNLIYDENAATYSFVDAFNIGLLMSGMVLTNYTYINSYLPMILTGSAGEFRLFWGTAMGQLMLYDYDINRSSSYIRVDTRTTVL